MSKHVFKTILPLTAAGILIAGVTSCSKNDSTPPFEGETFVVGTYADWDGTVQGKTFLSGSEIGLYAVVDSGEVAADRYLNNVKMIQWSGSFRAESKLVLKKDRGSTLYAYYPYFSTPLPAGTNQMQVSVNTNQTSNYYAMSDFMLGSKRIDADHKDQVPIAFDRMFSKMDIELVATGDVTLEELADAEVTLLANTTANVNFTDKTILSTSNAQEIEPYGTLTVDGDKLTGPSAIVVPQTVAADADFVYIKLNGKKTAYPAGRLLEMKSGMQYTLTIEIGGRDAETAKVTSVREVRWLAPLKIEDKDL